MASLLGSKKWLVGGGFKDFFVGFFNEKLGEDDEPIWSNIFQGFATTKWFFDEKLGGS